MDAFKSQLSISKTLYQHIKYDVTFKAVFLAQTDIIHTMQNVKSVLEQRFAFKSENLNLVLNFMNVLFKSI